MEARLKVFSGPFSGHTIRMPPGKFLVGRERDCQLILDDLWVSRHHCVFILDDWKLRVRDLGSRNGTMINGNRIGAWEIALSHGDVISVGPWAVGVEIPEDCEIPNQHLSDSHATTRLVTRDTTLFDEVIPHCDAHEDGL